MKLPGGMDIKQMMKQVQKMQEETAKAMAETRVEATAGGVVTVNMNGAKKVLAIRIDPEVVKEGDIEMLQDLIVAAVNEANNKADEAMQQKLGNMLPPGLNIPGLF